MVERKKKDRKAEGGGKQLLGNSQVKYEGSKRNPARWTNVWVELCPDVR